MPKTKLLTRDDLENFGSLITLKNEPATCLGDLWYAGEHGAFDPSYGKVPVTADEVKAHNAALSKAKLEGMDKNCEIGQGGSAYVYMGDNPCIAFFDGTVVSTVITKRGQSITFTRNGKNYRGRLSQKHDLFNFRRIS